MKIFQEKRKMMSRLYSRATIFALMILALFLGKGVWDIYGRERESAKMRADSAKKLEDVNKEKQNIAHRVERLQSDAGVESEIRSKFNVAKPDENVVLIVGGNASSTASSTPGFFASLWAKIWK
jgi:cell division protein FtsB